jgi:hypothetical protein
LQTIKILSADEQQLGFKGTAKSIFDNIAAKLKRPR